MATGHGQNCCCTLCLEDRAMARLPKEMRGEKCSYCATYPGLHMTCADSGCRCRCHTGPFSGWTVDKRGA
jgi:hypothetical protein